MSGVRPSSQRNQGEDTRSRKDKKWRSSPEEATPGGSDSTRPYLPQIPELLNRDPWGIEKQVIVEQRLQLQQQLNEDIQKLGVQFLTDIRKLGQKEAVLNERLSSTSRYSSQLLEGPPVSSSTISPYTHIGAPSAAICEHVPWAWPPSMDQGTLGINKTPLFETNSPTVREYTPAVIQPGILTEGEGQGHQSDALASTVSLHNEPIQPPLKPTTLSAGRRGRHSNALDQLGRELDTYDDKPESDSETDDSTTGMYIPAVIHDKARGLRRRTK